MWPTLFLWAIAIERASTIITSEIKRGKDGVVFGNHRQDVPAGREVFSRVVPSGLVERAPVPQEQLGNFASNLCAQETFTFIVHDWRLAAGSENYQCIVAEGAALEYFCEQVFTFFQRVFTPQYRECEITAAQQGRSRVANFSSAGGFSLLASAAEIQGDDTAKEHTLHETKGTSTRLLPTRTSKKTRCSADAMLFESLIVTPLLPNRRFRNLLPFHCRQDLHDDLDEHAAWALKIFKDDPEAMITPQKALEGWMMSFLYWWLQLMELWHIKLHMQRPNQFNFAKGFRFVADPALPWVTNGVHERKESLCELAKLVASTQKLDRLKLLVGSNTDQALVFQKADPKTRTLFMETQENALRKLKLLKIVEVGVFAAKTSLFMLRECALNPAEIRLQYHLIDPWVEDAAEFKSMQEFKLRGSGHGSIIEDIDFSSFTSTDDIDVTISANKYVQTPSTSNVDGDALFDEVLSKISELQYAEIIQHPVVSHGMVKLVEDGEIVPPDMPGIFIHRKLSARAFRSFAPPGAVWSGGLQGQSKNSVARSRSATEKQAVESSGVMEQRGVMEQHEQHKEPDESGVVSDGHQHPQVQPELLYPIDVAFIDGDHSLRGFAMDLIGLAPLTRYVLAGHDFAMTRFPGIPMALMLFLTNCTAAHRPVGCGYRLPIHIDSDYVWWLKSHQFQD